MDADYLIELTEEELLEPAQDHREFHGYERREQIGPLRWYDKEMRCASRGCGSPTTCKLNGIPYCMMHSLRLMNRMLSENS